MTTTADSNSDGNQDVLDAVVIGAGFTGLYQLWSLRRLGLRVRVLEAGAAVGGTWYWNCYPGARTDSPSNIYQYWFSDELLNDWQWSERFVGQRESERYLNHVADRFDLRRDISLNTRVVAARWDDDRAHWTVTTDGDGVLHARFVITAMGALTAPLIPPFPGHGTFRGRLIHTSRWPKEGIELRGKRVGVIGTGATGVQVIQTIAPEVASLTVFQRTANYMLPMKNRRYTDEDRAQIKRRYPQTREAIWEHFVGFDDPPVQTPFFELSREQRREVLEALWDDGSMKLWVSGFAEVFFDEAANEEVSAFVREKIRARVRDPEVAARLTPRDHGFGTRRVPLENGYFEVFNAGHVRLVDLRETPIECLTETGIRTSAGDIALDVIVLATGFDAGTGALTAIDIRGRGGISLREQWATEVRTTMGMQIHGYPNLFTTSAPYAAGGAFCNAPTCIQQQVQWISECIGYLRGRGLSVIEPQAETEQRWMEHHDELAATTLLSRTRSWYTGRNVAGKPQRLLGYFGGVPAYRQQCEAVKARGYEGFALE